MLHHARPAQCIYAPNPTTSEPFPSDSTHHEDNIKETRNSLRALLDGGLLGGGAAGLGGSALLLLLLGKLDGGGAGDGGGAQVSAVATLGGGVDDALVELAAGGGGGEGRGLLRLGGLVAAAGELGGQADGVGGVGVDANGLGLDRMLGICSRCGLDGSLLLRAGCDQNRTCSLTKPAHLRECLLVRLRGSRESWTPLRLTR